MFCAFIKSTNLQLQGQQMEVVTLRRALTTSSLYLVTPLLIPAISASLGGSSLIVGTTPMALHFPENRPAGSPTDEYSLILSVRTPH
jgi:hypothetical protein